MSHVAAIDLFVDDLDALDRACADLGLRLVRNQTQFTWFGRWMNDYNDPERAAALKGYDPKTFGRCEHVIQRADHTPGHYEIGLVRRPDGKPGWSVVYDDYSTGRYFTTKFGGKDLPELKSHYGAAVTEKHLASHGYATRRQYNKDGQLQVVATKF